MKRFTLSAAVICIVAFALTSLGQNEPPAAPASPDQQQASPQPSAPTIVQYPPTQLLSPPPAPPTILESQSLAKGVVMIKGYTDVATLAGDDDSSVRTTAIQIANPTQKFYGIIFTVHQNDRVAGVRNAIAYIDEDEIEPLAGAVDTLARLERGASVMNDFEGHFRTRGNLEITNYDRSGARMIAVRAVQVLLPSGEITWATARFSVARLTELRQQLAAAREVLDRAKSATPAGSKDEENK